MPSDLSAICNRLYDIFRHIKRYPTVAGSNFLTVTSFFLPMLISMSYETALDGRTLGQKSWT
jgi:hypothetical protein